MKHLLLISIACMNLLFSCNQDDNQIQYPKSFAFHHSDIIKQKAFVIGEHETYVEINSNSGNLKEFNLTVTSDLYGYLRNITTGNYVDSIELLTPDSLRIKIWENGIIESYTLSAKIENENVEIRDTNFYISKVHWDKAKQEMKFCLALSLGILERNGVFIPELGYNYCESTDLDKEFKNILAEDDYRKNDTLGVYLMDMIYKEN